MVPTEELSWIRTRAKQTKDLVSVGQHLQAVVTGVDLTRRHVQLSVRQAARSPLGNRAGAAAEEGARREGAARRAQQWSSDRELIEGAIKLRVVSRLGAVGCVEVQERVDMLDGRREGGRRFCS